MENQERGGMGGRRGRGKDDDKKKVNKIALAFYVS